MSEWIHLSQQLLLGVKTGKDTQAIQQALAGAEGPALAAALTNDNDRKAFWINVYNAYTQLILRQQPEQYQRRRQFYARKQIAIAGEVLSLNEIEHGILRRSKIVLSLGYLNKWRISAFERLHRVERVDPRLHFALNCGARSCPPVRFYEPTRLDEQLNLATASYLNEMVQYDAGRNTVHIPKLFLWFMGDFGGLGGTRCFLQQHGIIPGDARPAVRYTRYDWGLHLENFG